MSHICHIDESGDFGPLLSAGASVQPVLAVVGLIAPKSKIAQMESDFAQLRKTSEYLKNRRSALRQSHLPPEDKGHELRWGLRSDEPQWQAGALATLDATLNLLERAEAQVAGCVNIKPMDRKFNGKYAYVSSVLSIAANFHRILEAEDPEEEARHEGEIICDEQQQAKSAIRRGFRRRQLPVPEFGNSEQNAGIQIADWLCSAIIAPLAATRLSPESKHADTRYLALAGGENSVWERLMRMQFPFADDNGLRQPGIIVRPEKMRAKLFPEPVLGDPPA